MEAIEKQNRNFLINLVNLITPIDDIEKKTIKEVSEWLEGSNEVYRIQKPDIPPKHLVAYGVVLDIPKKKILLFNHKKSGLFLPSGGHLEKYENPLDAAKRELFEETGITDLILISGTNPDVPFFVTSTETVGPTAGHTDVDMWFLFLGMEEDISLQKGKDFFEEFDGYEWYPLQVLKENKLKDTDPNMARFILKLDEYI